MFNFIDIYSFIHETGCVGMDPIVLLFQGVNNADKTFLSMGFVFLNCLFSV